jgi:rod shape-determining protein MreC
VLVFTVALNLGKQQSWNPLEQIIIELIAPFQKFIQRTIDTTEGIWESYFHLISVHDDNIRLKNEIDTLKMENAQFRELVATYQRLQGLLQFKETIDFPVIAAQVIGRDPSGWFQSVIIDKGKRSGLVINMPVVNAEGVVGRLVSVSTDYAKVLLIIDQNSAVDGIIQRSRDTGIVKGISSTECELEYVLKTSDVTIDDVVVTSGLGRIFPKGIPVGRVTEVDNVPGELFKWVKIEPMVDFSRLEELLVILKEDPLSSHPKEGE